MCSSLSSSFSGMKGVLEYPLRVSSFGEIIFISEMVDFVDSSEKNSDEGEVLAVEADSDKDAEITDVASDSLTGDSESADTGAETQEG